MNQQRNLAISILISAIIVAGAIVYVGVTSRGGSANTGAKAAAPSIGNDPYIGNPSAPLTLYYWRDFQCPFCGKFDTQTLPALVSEYVDTGKLRIVFKDFVFLGSDSATAAGMSHAVWEASSSSYYAWQHAIFSAQGTEGSGWASPANLVAITKTVPGLDATSVVALMNKNGASYQADMNNDYLDAQRLGIQGTPGFWLDGQTLSGAQPIGFFEQIINADLAQS